jgi:hypothetical protein
MPELSKFLGIVIGIFPREHPPPHFHAVYGEYQITVDIKTGVVSGEFPRRALRHVLEWYDLHQSELLEDWNLIQTGHQPKKIDPLE